MPDPPFNLQYYLSLVGGLLVVANTLSFIPFLYFFPVPFRFPILEFSLGLAIVLLSRLFRQIPEKHVGFGYTTVALSLVAFFSMDSIGNPLYLPGMVGAGIALVGGLLSLGLAGPHIGEPPAADSVLCILGGAFVFAPNLRIGYLAFGGSMATLYGLATLFCGAMLHTKPDRRKLWGTIVIVTTLVFSTAGWLVSGFQERGAHDAGVLLALVGGMLAIIWNRRTRKPATIP